MPSAATVIGVTAFLTLFLVYVSWSETSRRYELWDELAATPWTNHDAWQARLDRMQDIDQMQNLVTTAAFVTAAATAMLACALRGFAVRR